MPKVGKIVKENKPKVNDKDNCVACGKETKDFYQSNSSLWASDGRLKVCKECIGKLFDGYVKKHESYKKAMYYLCRKLDVPFNTSAYMGAEKTVEKSGWKIWQGYFKELNSFGDKNSYGIDFDSSDDFLEEKNINQDENNFIDIDYSEVEIGNDLVFKWGNLPKKDIVFLENEYKDWCSRYDVSSKAMEVNVKEICYQQLLIKQKREMGQSAEKELKSLSELMGNSALKPIQESAAMSAEFNTLGTWIKKFEQEEPCPEVDEDLKDVDNFLKYIRVWFVGHLCRILGINNEFSEEYDRELLEYTINFKEDEDASNIEVGDD